jgi:hypothetical protein
MQAGVPIHALSILMTLLANQGILSNGESKAGVGIFHMGAAGPMAGFTVPRFENALRPKMENAAVGSDRVGRHDVLVAASANLLVIHIGGVGKGRIQSLPVDLPRRLCSQKERQRDKHKKLQALRSCKRSASQGSPPLPEK